MSDYQSIFTASQRPHILMITNHGVHQWKIVPGLPDTGGQNVFVNQFTAALAKLGFKITIANRGGYPHPKTGEDLVGLHYKDEHQRILYLQDGKAEFVRKEDMHAQIPALVQFLQDFLKSEGAAVDLIISHYWDAAVIGAALNASLPTRLKHIWVPHSVGALKKRNINPGKWEGLRIDERIAAEKAVIRDLDGIAATSSIIRQSLADDYGYATPEIFLPPCVDAERYHPREIAEDAAIWDFLGQHAKLTPAEIRSRKIITEISRTDTTKRKDVLIRAFAQIQAEHPNTLLVITIDKNLDPVGLELVALIQALGIKQHVIVLGSVWDQLPDIYAVTDIYCTPSVMEGFGMSPQEAAATRVPTVSSNLVPYVTEYLLGAEASDIPFSDEGRSIQKGAGAIVVQADDVEGFAFALNLLLSDDGLRSVMGAKAYAATIPYFTWDHLVRVFLNDIGFEQD
jgi:glycosyltransferase involved in cell wall biosynthesis